MLFGGLEPPKWGTIGQYIYSHMLHTAFDALCQYRSFKLIKGQLILHVKSLHNCRRITIIASKVFWVAISDGQ